MLLHTHPTARKGVLANPITAISPVGLNKTFELSLDVPIFDLDRARIPTPLFKRINWDTDLVLN